jgi:hypothetical protein
MDRMVFVFPWIEILAGSLGSYAGARYGMGGVSTPTAALLGGVAGGIGGVVVDSLVGSLSASAGANTPTATATSGTTAGLFYDGPATLGGFSRRRAPRVLGG